MTRDDWPGSALLPWRTAGAFGRADCVNDSIPPLSHFTSGDRAGLIALAQEPDRPWPRRPAGGGLGIFSTKHREPFITPVIETELHPYMATIFRALKSPSLTIDGTTDHVHVLFSLGRVITIADVVEEVKTETSKWIKTKSPEFRNFHWQKGYGAFSIGQSKCGCT